MLSDSQKPNLLVKLALSWPPKGKYMTKRDFETLIECSSGNLEKMEAQRGGGNMVYMHTKLKMHADYYGLHYSIPFAYEEACKQREREMNVKRWKFWK